MSDADAAEDGVLRLRRLQVLESLAEVVAERGLQATSVAAVCERASISRGVFNRLFADLDDCFLALVDRTLARMTAAICEAQERERSWVEGIIAALEAMVSFLDADPAAARACLLGRAAAGPEALESRAMVLERLKLIIDGAREQLPSDAQPPAVMAEATVLSVLGIMRRRLMNDQAPPFAPLLGQLVEATVAPYLGPAVAAQAAAACDTRVEALMRARSGDSPQRPRPEALEMLCHAGAHRMRACLLHLAGNPGASNRAIGSAIGIAHPGQASTLLSRLHDGGLLVKRHAGAGHPNAWLLSSYGVEVAEALAGAPADAPVATPSLAQAI